MRFTHFFKISLGLLSMAACSVLTVTDLPAESEGSSESYKQILKRLTPLEGSTPAQWRVVWTNDGRHEATISWTTAVAGKNNVVHLSTKLGSSVVEEYSKHIKSAKDGAYSFNAKEAKKHKLKPAFYHHVKLTGLKPGTRYNFLIETDGKFSRPLHFFTCPDKLPYKLIHGGDSRSGLYQRCQMNKLIAEQVKNDPSIIGLCHGGDYVISGHSWRHWRAWLSHNELLTLPDGRVVPIIPTLGNHDGGPMFYEVFNLEKHAPGVDGAAGVRRNRCYWQTTALGGGVNIVTLDTNYSAKGAQEKWLEQQLSELRPKSRWLLTNYHRPLYPAVKNDPAHKNIFVPLFEKYNVDLALESDGHCIKRTVAIRGGKPDPSGVTYIGEGGLGVSQRKPKKDLWYLQGGLVGAGHHIMLLDFQKETLGIDVILMDGSVKDSFKLKVRSK